ncbi:hypothetical protein CRE_19953 [Caenorhabditis remanei]|uniref:Uncharacterized protein n=1 Tax=Caenorhabditis remanei TaxID=31234 RepID=E3N8H7_CAERE|nr:hypothetical protein CRE_19953 [Caenorhabditis remanei]
MNNHILFLVITSTFFFSIAAGKPLQFMKSGQFEKLEFVLMDKSPSPNPSIGTDPYFAHTSIRNANFIGSNNTIPLKTSAIEPSDAELMNENNVVTGALLFLIVLLIFIALALIQSIWKSVRRQNTIETVVRQKVKTDGNENE